MLPRWAFILTNLKPSYDSMGSELVADTNSCLAVFVTSSSTCQRIVLVSASESVDVGALAQSMRNTNHCALGIAGGSTGSICLLGRASGQQQVCCAERHFDRELLCFGFCRTADQIVFMCAHGCGHCREAQVVAGTKVHGSGSSLCCSSCACRQIGFGVVTSNFQRTGSIHSHQAGVSVVGFSCVCFVSLTASALAKLSFHSQSTHGRGDVGDSVGTCAVGMRHVLVVAALELRQRETLESSQVIAVGVLETHADFTETTSQAQETLTVVVGGVSIASTSMLVSTRTDALVETIGASWVDTLLQSERSLQAATEVFRATEAQTAASPVTIGNTRSFGENRTVTALSFVAHVSNVNVTVQSHSGLCESGGGSQSSQSS